MDYLLDEDGNKIECYHGTVREFNFHSLEKARTELNEKYQGDAICYTEDEKVAWQYVDAARNQMFNKEEFLNETSNVFKNKDPKVGKWIEKIAVLIMENGYTEGWDLFLDDYIEKNEFEGLENKAQAVFQRFDKFKKETGFDIDEFCSVLNYVERSRSNENDLQDAVFNLFNRHIDKLPQRIINNLKDWGYKDIIPKPQIIVSNIKYNKMIKTKNQEKAREAFNSGKYDLVIYTGTHNTVAQKREIMIKSPEQIEMKAKIKRYENHYENEEGYDVTEYSFKKEILNNKKLKKTRKI